MSEIDTYRGGYNVFPLFRGRWQASAGWALPGEAADGHFVGGWPHFALSRSMSRRRCKRWVKRLADAIKKGKDLLAAVAGLGEEHTQEPQP